MMAPRPRSTIGFLSPPVPPRPDLVPFLFRDLEERLARLDADIVVEDVQGAPPLDRRVDHGLAVSLARHVGGEDRGLAALLRDQLGRLLGILGLGARAEDARPLAGEEDGGRLAIAGPRPSRARARDD